MSPAHRRYFAVEMAVAAAINAALSAGFAFLVFGGQSEVPVSGWGGVAADAAPQSFMIALMSCLVPTLLTRRRVRAGRVAPMAPPIWRFPGLATRAAGIAIVVSLAALGSQAALLPRFGAIWSFPAVLAFKCVYGAVLGASISAISIRLALGERPARSPM